MANILQAYEQGLLSNPRALIAALRDFITPFLDAEHGVQFELDSRTRRFLEAGVAAYRSVLGNTPPPRRYALALRMMGLGVQTRSRARREAAALANPPDDPPSRTPLPPPSAQAEVGSQDLTPERRGELEATHPPSPRPLP